MVVIGCFNLGRYICFMCILFMMLVVVIVMLVLVFNCMLNDDDDELFWFILLLDMVVGQKVDFFIFQVFSFVLEFRMEVVVDCDFLNQRDLLCVDQE